MRIRRVRYASRPRARRWPTAAPWRRRSGPPAAGARWPGSGGRSGARPARRSRPARTWCTRTGGCRPASPRRPTSPLVLTVARHRRARCSAAPGWRGGWRARCSRARAVVTAVSRELAGWVQNATGRHIATAHVHPMPVDTADLALDHGRRRDDRRRAPHRAEADQPGHRDHGVPRLVRPRPPAHGRRRWAGARGARAPGRSGSASHPSSASSAPCRRTR